MTTLRCVVERITYQNPENGYSVLKVKVKGYDDLVTLVGNLLEVPVGSVLLCRGEWKVVRADKCHSRNSRSGATIASIAKHSGRPLAPGSAFQVGIGSGCGIAVSAIFRIFTEYWHCSMM